MRKIIINKLGRFGNFLYIVFIVLISAFPLYIITSNSIEYKWIYNLFIIIEYFIPVFAAFVWLLGFIIAVTSPQTAFIFLYYIMFAIVETSFIVCIIIAIRKRKRSESEGHNETKKTKGTNKSETISSSNMSHYKVEQIVQHPEFKEILCPACHEKILVDKTKDVVFCQSCGKKLTKKKKQPQN